MELASVARLTNFVYRIASNGVETDQLPSSVRGAAIRGELKLACVDTVLPDEFYSTVRRTRPNYLYFSKLHVIWHSWCPIKRTKQKEILLQGCHYQVIQIPGAVVRLGAEQAVVKSQSTRITMKLRSSYNYAKYTLNQKQ